MSFLYPCLSLDLEVGLFRAPQSDMTAAAHGVCQARAETENT